MLRKILTVESELLVVLNGPEGPIPERFSIYLLPNSKRYKVNARKIFNRGVSLSFTQSDADKTLWKSVPYSLNSVVKELDVGI